MKNYLFKTLSKALSYKMLITMAALSMAALSMMWMPNLKADAVISRVGVTTIYDLGSTPFIRDYPAVTTEYLFTKEDMQASHDWTIALGMTPVPAGRIKKIGFMWNHYGRSEPSQAQWATAWAQDIRYHRIRVEMANAPSYMQGIPYRTKTAFENVPYEVVFDATNWGPRDGLMTDSTGLNVIQMSATLPRGMSSFNTANAFDTRYNGDMLWLELDPPFNYSGEGGVLIKFCISNARNTGGNYGRVGANYHFISNFAITRTQDTNTTFIIDTNNIVNVSTPINPLRAFSRYTPQLDSMPVTGHNATAEINLCAWDFQNLQPYPPGSTSGSRGNLLGCVNIASNDTCLGTQLFGLAVSNECLCRCRAGIWSGTACNTNQGAAGEVYNFVYDGNLVILDGTFQQVTTRSTGGSLQERPVTWFDVVPRARVVDVYPRDTAYHSGVFGDITTPYITMYVDGDDDEPIQIRYRVFSPLGAVIFESHDRITNDTWVDVIPPKRNEPFDLYFDRDRVRGSGVDISNPDVQHANLSFRGNSISGGTHTVTAEIRYKNNPTQVTNADIVTRYFNVMFPYDIRLLEIANPSENEIYPINNRPLKFTSRITNVGENEFSNFNIHYTILRAGTTDTVWQKTYNMSLSNPLKYNEILTHEVSDFIPSDNTNIAGVYRLYVSVALVGVNEPINARIDNTDFTDFVLDIYDGYVESAGVAKNIHTDQPMYPKVEVNNAGGFIAALVPISVTIKDDAGAVVYEATEYIPQIPSRELTTYEFITPFFPRVSGNYTLEAELSANDDYNVSNNSGSTNFTVSPSLTGTKTIGSGINNDYATITAAIADVYRMGVQDTITFVLNDAVMNLGDETLPYALDFSTLIAGFNQNKLIRFVPSEQLAARQGSIRIVTRSATGIGIRFASSLTSQFANAPINVIKTDSRSLPFGHSKMDYYLFNARVEFDGGSNKSIQFETGTGVSGTNRIPVFIAEGVQNITFRNCIFKGESVASPQLPTVSYNVGLNRFTFSNIENVSTSILLRNVPPAAGTNIRLDSPAVLISNINIADNIFTNGSYGIVSIGIGPQYNNDSGNFIPYYNEHNNFVGNEFSDLDNAAIFLGYESNSLVGFNRINKIGQSKTGDYDNAGIILGGFGTANTSVNGYNNLNVTVNGNEISNVASSKDAYGIKVEQERNNFSYLQTIIQRYIPNGNDSLKIFNNVVWGLKTNTDAGSRYGIRLFSTRRSNVPNAFDAFAEPRENNYHISHSQIINNTILIDEDGREGDASAYIGGIVAQNVTNFQHYNNAIAILDNTTNANADIVAPFVLQSARPNAINRIESNNNIYYNANTDDVLIRFIENSPYDGSLREAGFRGQYVGLDQWQFWNKSDMSSAENNFATGLETINVNSVVLGSVPSLRVKAPSAVGYYLYNRGRIFPAVTTDIFGNVRGQNDRAYNVGAWEFTGSLYDYDIEVAGFITPGSYKDLSDENFRLAEYVMTTSPVDVAVYVKNNGNKKIENVFVTLRVLREGSLVKEYRKQVSVSVAEIVSLSFLDVIRAEDFPLTYQELHQTPPEYLASMVNNVTPIYTFEVFVPSGTTNAEGDHEGDQDASNDLKSKDVRFFVKKSKINTLLSVANADFIEHSFTGDYIQHIAENKVVTTEADFADVAGYLNYRSLYDGIIALGYNYDTTGFDLLDRKNWERNSVNYTSYLSLFWADGLNNTLTDEQEAEVNDFINRSSTMYKHNLIFASEELARNSTEKFNSNQSELDFVRLWFATTRLGNGIWSGAKESDGSILLRGVRINKDSITSIRNTPLVDLNKDRSFSAGIFGNYNSTVRAAAQAFFYTKPLTESQLNKTFGVVSYSVYDNRIYLGADWRNLDSNVLGGILEFIGGLNEVDFQLSVELLDFNAYLLNNKVQLVWETSNEHTTSKFVVEKAATSGAGVVFKPINEVQANRNSSISNSYSAIDGDIFAGNTYIYRLKSIDVSGNATYSNEKMINVDANNNLISLDKPHPNPASNDIIINFNLSTEMDIRLSIFDINGNEVVVVREGMFSPKTHKFNFSIANLASGTYNLVLRANGNIIAQQFNIVK